MSVTGVRLIGGPADGERVRFPDGVRGEYLRVPGEGMQVATYRRVEGCGEVAVWDSDDLEVRRFETRQRVTAQMQEQRPELLEWTAAECARRLTAAVRADGSEPIPETYRQDIEEDALRKVTEIRCSMASVIDHERDYPQPPRVENRRGAWHSLGGGLSVAPVGTPVW